MSPRLGISADACYDITIRPPIRGSTDIRGSHKVEKNEIPLLDFRAGMPARVLDSAHTHLRTDAPARCHRCAPNT